MQPLYATAAAVCHVDDDDDDNNVCHNITMAKMTETISIISIFYLLFSRQSIQ